MLLYAYISYLELFAYPVKLVPLYVTFISCYRMPKLHGSCCLTAFRSLRLKCDGTPPETRFRLSAKRTSPFKSSGASVQSTTGSRGVRISCSNGGYTMFRGRVKGTGSPLHLPCSSSLPLPFVTVCHYVSGGLYLVILCLYCTTSYSILIFYTS